MENRMRFFVVLVASWLLVPLSAAATNVIGVGSSAAGYAVYERENTSYRVVVGVPIHAGDILRSGKTGKIKVTLKDNSVLSMAPNTKLKVSNMLLKKERNFVVDVLLGRFKMDIAKWFLGKTNGEIRTPTSVAGVRGTVVWGDVEADAICALEGVVDLAPLAKPENKEQLTAGQCRGGMQQGQLKVLKVPTDVLEQYLLEFEVR